MYLGVFCVSKVINRYVTLFEYNITKILFPALYSLLMLSYRADMGSIAILSAFTYSMCMYSEHNGLHTMKGNTMKNKLFVILLLIITVQISGCLVCGGPALPCLETPPGEDRTCHQVHGTEGKTECDPMGSCVDNIRGYNTTDTYFTVCKKGDQTVQPGDPGYENCNYNKESQCELGYWVLLGTSCVDRPQAKIDCGDPCIYRWDETPRV